MNDFVVGIFMLKSMQGFMTNLILRKLLEPQMKCAFITYILLLSFSVN